MTVCCRPCSNNLPPNRVWFLALKTRGSWAPEACAVPPLRQQTDNTGIGVAAWTLQQQSSAGQAASQLQGSWCVAQPEPWAPSPSTELLVHATKPWCMCSCNKLLPKRSTQQECTASAAHEQDDCRRLKRCAAEIFFKEATMTCQGAGRDLLSVPCQPPKRRQQHKTGAGDKLSVE